MFKVVRNVRVCFSCITCYHHPIYVITSTEICQWLCRLSMVGTLCSTSALGKLGYRLTKLDKNKLYDVKINSILIFKIQRCLNTSWSTSRESNDYLLYLCQEKIICQLCVGYRKMHLFVIRILTLRPAVWCGSIVCFQMRSSLVSLLHLL